MRNFIEFPAGRQTDVHFSGPSKLLFHLPNGQNHQEEVSQVRRNETEVGPVRMAGRMPQRAGETFFLQQEGIQQHILSAERVYIWIY